MDYGSFLNLAILSPVSESIIAPIESDAKPYVVVDIRTSIVQIQVEHASIGTVVPIATTDRETRI
jgi:hypothetical protein